MSASAPFAASLPGVQLRGASSTRRCSSSSLRLQTVRGASTRPRAPRRGVLLCVAGSKLSLIAHGTNLPHPDKVAKGGEDAWFVRIDAAGGGQMFLADGVGSFNEQGIDPGLYARVLTYEAAKAHAGMAGNPLSRQGGGEHRCAIHHPILRVSRCGGSRPLGIGGHA